MMRIAGKSWAVKSAEQSYHKVSPGVKSVQKANPAKKIEKTSGLHGLRKIKPQKQLEPKDILSKDELTALTALFVKDQYFNFYGHAKVQQVQPGMLLDLKG
jgi:hypothetical protein